MRFEIRLVSNWGQRFSEAIWSCLVNFSFVTYQTEKLRPQRILIKTTSMSDHHLQRDRLLERAKDNGKSYRKKGTLLVRHHFRNCILRADEIRSLFVPFLSIVFVVSFRICLSLQQNEWKWRLRLKKDDYTWKRTITLEKGSPLTSKLFTLTLCDPEATITWCDLSPQFFCIDATLISANLKAIRCESTSLNRIVADKSHHVIVT